MQWSDRPENINWEDLNPNTRFNRPPPFTAQQKLILDKNNLLDVIRNLYTWFEASPTDTENTDSS